jgi:amino acid transporter
MLFEETNFHLILLLVFLALNFFFMFWFFKAKSIEGQQRKWMWWQRGIALGLGAVLLCLWFLLPHTPVLSTFGYPEQTADIDTPEKLLRYLQGTNRALVRTIDVLRNFLFVFVWIFLASIYGQSKLMTKELNSKRSTEVEHGGETK